MLDLDVETTAKAQKDANLCRLCLKQDDFVIDIFEHQHDDDLRKTTLAQRLFEFFQIKYEKSKVLPNNICQRCLYMVEAFSSFHKNVQKCELELQKRALEENQTSSSDVGANTELKRAGLNGCPGIFEPEEDSVITVVDPMQEYESSEDDFSMESDSEMEDPPPPSDQHQPVAVTIPTNPHEVPETHVEQIIPSERPKNKEMVSFASPNLETLAMEFTKNTFLCQYCDMAFTTHLDCADHESRHDPLNPFTCNFCPLRTSNRQNLIYHIKDMHDNERPYVCALCNKGFCRRSDLKKHTIVHTGVRPFTCPVCAKSFSRNTNLTKHMRIHSGVKPHVCQKCPRSFTTSGELQRHARSHSEIKPFQCSKCTASFTRKDKLVLHEQAHNRKDSEFILNQTKPFSSKDIQNRPTIQPQTENIVVSLNPFIDVNAQMDINYLPTHDSHGQRLQYPTLAPEATPTQHSILAAQLQQNRPPSRNTGTPSSQADKSRTGSRSHPRIIACEICAKTFTRERDLQRHSALHLDKLFTCKQCGRGFNRREKLMRHEHEQHRPQFTCAQCRMTFSKREALSMHMKVHELQHNMAMTQVQLSTATSGSSGNSSAISADLLQKRLNQQQPTSASDLTFYSQMVPTMNLGFYSETRPEDRNGA